MKLITLVLVATFLTLSSLCVQGSPEDGLSRWKDQSVQQPADDPLLRWMNKIAQQELQARENAIAQIRTVADANLGDGVLPRLKFLLCDLVHPSEKRVIGRLLHTLVLPSAKAVFRRPLNAKRRESKKGGNEH